MILSCVVFRSCITLYHKMKVFPRQIPAVPLLRWIYRNREVCCERTVISKQRETGILTSYSIGYRQLAGQGSVEGKRTHYRLDGPRCESQWRARFSTPVQTGCGAHPASYTMSNGSFLGVKRPGWGVDHPTSRAEGREWLELYVYSPTWPSWPVLG